MMNNEWFPERFGGIEIEKFILKNAHKSVDEDSPYIKFLYDTPFSNHLYLQIFYQKETLFIIKSTLQYSELEEKGTALVVIEEGTLSGTIAKDLIQSIKKVNVPIFVTKEEVVEWRDGASVELCIGRRFHETIFSWWLEIEPKSWDSLDVIARELLKVDKNTIYAKKAIKRVELAMEGKESFLFAKEEKSLWLTYKEIDEGSIL